MDFAELADRMFSELAPSRCPPIESVSVISTGHFTPEERASCIDEPYRLPNGNWGCHARIRNTNHACLSALRNEVDAYALQQYTAAQTPGIAPNPTIEVPAAPAQIKPVAGTQQIPSPSPATPTLSLDSVARDVGVFGSIAAEPLAQIALLVGGIMLLEGKLVK